MSTAMRRLRAMLPEVFAWLVFIAAAAVLLWLCAGCQSRTVVSAAESRAQRSTTEGTTKIRVIRYPEGVKP